MDEVSDETHVNHRIRSIEIVPGGNSVSNTEKEPSNTDWIVGNTEEALKIAGKSWFRIDI